MLVSDTTTTTAGIPLADDAEVTFAPEELARYARQLTTAGIGPAGQRRLKRARVLVVGAGGLGSPVIAYLARAGVGTIGVVDHDTVAASNLHRQILYGDHSIGLAKVASASEAVRAANPFVRVVEHAERLTADSAERLLSAYDLVIDGTDDFDTRYLVADTSERLGLPCVWGTVLGTDGQLSTFWAGAPGGGAVLRDLYPEPPGGDAESCATAGVIGPLCGIVASWMAVEAIKLIVGSGIPLVGRLLVVDAWDGTSREVEFAGGGARVPPRGPAIDWVEPGQLRGRLDGGAVLLDVREPWERDIAVIPGAVSVPLGSLDAHDLPDGPLILHCHHDTRARRARELLSHRTDAAVLRGGIDAYAAEADPAVPRY